LPAPVTMATRPSNLIAIVLPFFLLPLWEKVARKRRMRGCLGRRVRGEIPLTRLRFREATLSRKGRG